MKTRWNMMSAAVAGLCLLSMGSVGLAEDTVTLAVSSAPLEDVLDRLNEAAGTNIIAQKDILKEVVSVKANGQPIETVLRNLAWQYGFKLDPMPSGYRLSKLNSGQGSSAIAPSDGGGQRPEVGPPIPAIVNLPSAARQQVAMPNLAPSGVPSAGNVVQPHGGAVLPDAPVASGPVITRSIHLRYAVASELAGMFGCPGMVPTPYGLQTVRRQYKRPSTRVDLGRLDMPAGMMPTAQDLRNVERRYGTRPTYRPGTAGASTYAGEEFARDQFGGFGGGMGGPMGGGMGGPMGGGMGGMGGGMGGMGGGFGNQNGMNGQNQVRGVIPLPPGISSLIGYDLLSALIVTGDPDAIGQLKDLVAIFDLPPKQIEVEARFVTLTVNQASSLGITWSMTDGSTVVGGNTPSSGGSTLAVRTSIGNFTALLTTLQRSNQGKVVNAPKVIAQNAQPAYVSFTQEIPYVGSSTSTTNAGGFQQTGGDIEMLDVEVGIDVTARVTGQAPHESITVNLIPTVDDIVGYVDNPNGGTIPIVASQEIETEVRVPNGETIAMGGLVRKNNSTSGTKIPILGDLPFIGGLFRSRAKNDDESELLIFVTPSIIRERGVDYTVFGGAGAAAPQGPGQ